MEILRQVNDWELNKGGLMANGLFNVTNIENQFISNWFDYEIKDELLSLSDDKFIDRCIELTINSFNKK